jgi:hypothetical protein
VNTKIIQLENKLLNKLNPSGVTAVTVVLSSEGNWLPTLHKAQILSGCSQSTLDNYKAEISELRKKLKKSDSLVSNSIQFKENFDLNSKDIRENAERVKVIRSYEVMLGEKISIEKLVKAELYRVKRSHEQDKLKEDFDKNQLKLNLH